MDMPVVDRPDETPAAAGDRHDARQEPTKLTDPVCGMDVTAESSHHLEHDKADVGIAIGTGTDVAMNSAQLTLVKEDLRGIATARALSEATVANMKQNLGFAFVYNMLGVPLVAGVLFPFTGWLLSPMIGALAMSLSSVSVIGNALRLRIASIKVA